MATKTVPNELKQPFIPSSRERDTQTLEALEDVRKGNVVPHEEVLAWLHERIDQIKSKL